MIVVDDLGDNEMREKKGQWLRTNVSPPKEEVSQQAESHIII